MIKKRKRVLAIFILVFVMLLSVLPTHYNVDAAGISYYVSDVGNDNNNGLTVSAPFKTIQKAASVMNAGDTCYIRGGTYRETVTPGRSGTSGNEITFRNYNNETVIVNGTDAVTNWTQYSGNIYQANVSTNLGDGQQVFVNDNMMIEARWPNTGFDLLQPTLEVTDAGTNVSITDSNLVQPDGYWNGTKLWIVSGLEWIARCRTVNSYTQSTHTLTFDAIGSNNDADAYKPKAGNRYYLCGKLSELDTENEWFYNATEQKLYLWAPGGMNPNTSKVEIKSRSTGFDLSGKSYINITGISTFACTIKSNSTTNHCVLDSLNMKYLSHQFKDSADGIVLNGSYMELKNSILDTAYSNAVKLAGGYNRLVNCEVKNGGYGGTWESLVNVSGSNQLVSHNTIHEAGRDGMALYCKQSQIQYNDVYNVGYLQKDMGIIHFGNSEGDGTRIHHNWFHDGKAEGIMNGIYLDNIDNNYTIDHNVVWNCPEGIILNTPCRYALVYNNTFYGTGNNGGLNYWGARIDADDQYGGRVFNNIFTGNVAITGGMVMGKNIYSNTPPQFVNVAAKDFRLQSTSPAINAGIVIPGITDGYIGSAPDCGAYEYGEPEWVAGCDLANPPTVTYTIPQGIQYMNLISNGGFESGLTGWSKTDSNNAVLSYGDPWNSDVSNSRAQGAGVRLRGNIDGIERTLTNLEPNTVYTFSVWIKVDDGEKVEIGVKNYGGQNVSATSNQTTWRQLIVNFKTGGTNTTATVYIKKTSLGAGYVYADLAGVQQADPSLLGETFENGLQLWSGNGNVTNSFKRSGNNSYEVSDGNNIYRSLDSVNSKCVSLWLYDDASDMNLQALARADEGSIEADTGWRGMGVNTNVSPSNYCYRIGSSWYVSNVPRRTGWHELKWDYTTGGRLGMYIDDILIYSMTGVKGFSNIAMGDW